jgi:Flp pilus assembly pilin Flp
MLKQIKRFTLDESGLETIEWAMVGGVLTVVGVALFFAIGRNAFNGITSLSIETGMIP